MRVLAGLGNPGAEYDGTRHNAGFVCVDAVAKELGLDWKPFKNALVAKQGDMVLVKPQTFMNRSGEPLRVIMDYYDATELCVATDDVYLAPGSARIRKTGADGGHNGLKSLLEHLNDNFWRVRIGVGVYAHDPEVRQHQPALDHYVLQRLSEHDAKLVGHMVDNLVPNLIEWLKRGELAEHTLHI